MRTDRGWTAVVPVVAVLAGVLMLGAISFSLAARTAARFFKPYERLLEPARVKPVFGRARGIPALQAHGNPFFLWRAMTCERNAICCMVSPTIYISVLGDVVAKSPDGFEERLNALMARVSQ